MMILPSFGPSRALSPDHDRILASERGDGAAVVVVRCAHRNLVDDLEGEGECVVGIS